jgi:large subunit ribosomal protein L21
MFAIFENGGKQYKVSIGDTLQLEKMDVEVDDTITFKEVLLVSDDKDLDIGQPFVNKTIQAKVLDQNRAKKIRVVKFKSKKRYHKVQGHRQSYTEVEIISIGETKAKAIKKPVSKTEKTVEKVEKKPVSKTVKKDEKADTKTVKKTPVAKAKTTKKPVSKTEK